MYYDRIETEDGMRFVTRRNQDISQAINLLIIKNKLSSQAMKLETLISSSKVSQEKVHYSKDHALPAVKRRGWWYHRGV